MTKPNLKLDWQFPKVLVAPIRGKSAKKIFDEVPEHLRVGIRYDDKTQEIFGSTVFASCGCNDVLEKYGVRTPGIRDLSLSEVMAFARNKNYIDSRTQIARTPTDSAYSKNNSLLKQLYELAEGELGRVEHPFMIEGFTFEQNPDDENGYGLRIVKKPDLKIISDERLSGKYNGYKFSEVDENGLPKFDNKGTRTWYSRNNGLSRVFLNWDLGLGSDCRSLANSDDNGRVVALSAEASPKFFGR